MRRLGISLYPGHSSLEEMKQYVQLAHDNGFDRIFTCLMSLNNEQEREKLKQINAFAKGLGFDISADIAPNVFEELNLTYRDIGYLKQQYHLAALRLDMGFSGQEEAFMSLDASNLKVELNMSNGTKYVDNILSYQPNKANIIGCHNFYPRQYTGLSRQHFLKTSQQFKDNHIRTAAMISSQHGKFGPWEQTEYGLPTLEEHRFLPITVQAKDMWSTGLIDDCIIGNMYASEEELRALGQLNRYKLELQVEFLSETTALEEKIVLEEPHFNRGDVSDYVIRSTQSRVKYKTEDFPAHNTEPLVSGDITIDNNLDVRYKGELQIVLKNMPNAGSSNVVARVKEEERFLLKHIQPWASFGFTK
ncbi:MupG family TIM beta-alpha barrel fold protein [Metasolibacillus meyeri]|uniref:MupG family TIM beta-alpha barrel fold protein n=1 Tax=Metasolibacillus meyeri TaxID=1071052 RepID=A0AAW9NHY3_9BACL|nr:MupG family TIM beta-alpha barrel fold protein [Metasolibacillus meyeri]MEC1178279.1 MupG family TIM beta-alpha barrel fold protein [Metasolibacillus meyeri]